MNSLPAVVLSSKVHVYIYSLSAKLPTCYFFHQTSASKLIVLLRPQTSTSHVSFLKHSFVFYLSEASHVSFLKLSPTSRLLEASHVSFLKHSPTLHPHEALMIATTNSKQV